MSKEFWHQCWQHDNTPFHRSEVNEHLTQYFPQLASGARVLVPLCGKSLDMLWLQQQGYQVVGIELSHFAIEQFFTENSIPYTKKGECYQADGFSLYCADIFELAVHKQVDAVYDRAALIALPQKIRQAYVDKIGQWLKPNTLILLKTLSYANEFEGPPYSVDESEVRDLYQAYDINLLEQKNTYIAADSSLYLRGLHQTLDTVYSLSLSK